MLHKAVANQLQSVTQFPRFARRRLPRKDGFPLAGAPGKASFLAPEISHHTFPLQGYYLPPGSSVLGVSIISSTVSRQVK